MLNYLLRAARLADWCKAVILHMPGKPYGSVFRGYEDGAEAMIEEFHSLRPRLFGLAYRMLGSASEAEDILQEAYLRYTSAGPAQADQVDSPRSYLMRIVTNLCLDYLKSARVKREQYLGSWLPEPISTSGGEPASWESLEQRETISMAFLVLLESLTPYERAVFLLHDVFHYAYKDIAGMLDLSEANTRQIAHRARSKLKEKKPRFEVQPESHRQITERFLHACMHGDLEGLTALLSHDIGAWSDGGGKATSVRHPVHGRDSVMRLVLGLMKRAPEGIRFTLHEVNDAPSILMWAADQLINVLVPEIYNGQVYNLRFILNPDKLEYLTGQLRREIDTDRN